EARLPVDALPAGDDVVVALGLVGHQPSDPGPHRLPGGFGGRGHGQGEDAPHDLRVGLGAAGGVEHQPVDAAGMVDGGAGGDPAAERFAAQTDFLGADGVEEGGQVSDVVGDL